MESDRHKASGPRFLYKNGRALPVPTVHFAAQTGAKNGVAVRIARMYRRHHTNPKNPATCAADFTTSGFRRREI